MIVVYTKLYSHREKADISFKINNKKIRLFLRMLLLSGYNKLPDHKMYGRHPPILLCKQSLIQCLVIRLSIFFGIFIFVTKNNLLNKVNSRSSFPRLMNQIGDFYRFLSTGRTNPSYDSLLRNSWQ